MHNHLAKFRHRILAGAAAIVSVSTLCAATAIGIEVSKRDVRPSSGWPGDAPPRFRAERVPMQVEAINGKGRIAGSGGSSEGACIWERGRLTAIGSLMGREAMSKSLSASSAVGVEVRGINDKGHVVGIAPVLTGTSIGHSAFLWTGSKRPPRPLGGGEVARRYGKPPISVEDEAATAAFDINDASVVVGSWDLVAMYWDAKGNPRPLNVPADLGKGYSQAEAINLNGTIAGWYAFSDKPEHRAFVCEPGGDVCRFLPSGEATTVLAHDINGWGHVAGEADGHAVLWRSGKMEVLDSDPAVSPRNIMSCAWAVDNHSRVVGEYTRDKWVKDATQRDVLRTEKAYAFLWQRGRMYDVNELLEKPLPDGKRLMLAVDINDRGQILCRGEGGSYLLTPVSGGF